MRKFNKPIRWMIFILGFAIVCYLVHITGANDLLPYPRAVVGALIGGVYGMWGCVGLELFEE